MHSTPWRGRGEVQREGEGNGWEGSKEGREERQAETGNDLESQINKKKEGHQ